MTSIHNFGVFSCSLPLYCFSFFLHFTLLHCAVKSVLWVPAFILLEREVTNQNVVCLHTVLIGNCHRHVFSFPSNVLIIQSRGGQTVTGARRGLARRVYHLELRGNTSADCCPLCRHTSPAEGERASHMWVADWLWLSAHLRWPLGALSSEDGTAREALSRGGKRWLLKEFTDRIKWETSNSKIVKFNPVLE